MPAVFATDLQNLREWLNGQIPHHILPIQEKCPRICRDLLKTAYQASKDENPLQKWVEACNQDYTKELQYYTKELHPHIKTQIKTTEASITKLITQLAPQYIPEFITPNGEITPAGEKLLERPTLTAAEFIQNVTDNPRWAATITKPLEIVGDCLLRNSTIKAISPQLYFANDAIFDHTEHLTRLEGNFAGFVSAIGSHIQTIDIQITGANEFGWSAGFQATPKLHSISGNFAGAIALENSNIEEFNATIEGGTKQLTLKVTSPVSPPLIPKNTKAVLTNCKRLKLNPKLNGPEFLKDPEYIKQLRRLLASEKMRKSQPLEIG